MANFNKLLAKQKGLYRIAFTVCILILSGIVVTITENKETTDVPVAVENKREETELISKPMVDKAISGMNEQSAVSSVETVNETKIDAEESIDDVTISAPIYGKIIKSFSAYEPIYSKTMDDWRIHPGVDIACFYGAEIYAGQDGTITDIGYDINLGNYITVRNGEYELKYTSLSTDIDFEIGDIVSRGQIIGTVADSCVSEICDEPHFHFEIKKDNEYVDPTKFILFE